VAGNYDWELGIGIWILISMITTDGQGLDWQWLIKTKVQAAIRI
jgi:hypothetical protein